MRTCISIVGHSGCVMDAYSCGGIHGVGAEVVIVVVGIGICCEVLLPLRTCDEVDPLFADGGAGLGRVWLVMGME